MNQTLKNHLFRDSTGAHNSHLTVEGAGKYVGITVHINSSLDSYLSSSHPFYGTFIIIHEATNYPEFSKSVDLVQPGQEARLAVIPTVIVSTEEVRNMPLDQRYCLFPEEQEIALSEDYSFPNCLSECRAKVIVKACGCIPFYYPTFGEIYYYGKDLWKLWIIIQSFRCNSEFYRLSVEGHTVLEQEQK